ncbi:cytochrome c-type biogenesis protein CcmH [Hoeflea marina]|uniref:Cytochrome c-type biogenesis protein n=1 Tax=Hoeflea marina TaxID=274592 RepID=A0A317PNS9_9HYPH|nr:cytochrome c-type biogenesis protein [Hoeflea marina]PWW02233.1 cytochrome c-type biogenesis protein CcmH [Hoeflea marina]
MIRSLRPLGLALLLLLGSLAAAGAVTPDEMLDNPVLEQRARALSAELRCLVCQNQSIDDSNAELARDLRLLVRERLVDGDSDREVLDYVVSRYGEFVLLKPRLSVRTWLLWGTPVMMLLAGALALLAGARGRSRAVDAGAARLSEAEQQELARLLADRNPDT